MKKIHARLSAMALLCTGTLAAFGERPNILFIAVDDLNRWIGALNTHPQVQTPNLDALAERGTLFSNHSVQAPLCNPSRVSLMSGLRPTTTGVYGLGPAYFESKTTRDTASLPQYFAEHGYETFGVGKVFHYDADNKAAFQVEGTRITPFGPLPEKKLVPHPPDMVAELLVDWGVYPESDSTRIHDYEFTTWAVERLEEFRSARREQPFFLALGLWLPHLPFYTTPEWFDLYPPNEEIYIPPVPVGDRDDVPEFAWKLHWSLPEPRLTWLKKYGEWAPKIRAYLAAISFMDAQVGRVLAALEEQGLAENTVVVFWSDNGYHFGEKGITGKNSLWEPSLRTPLIFAGPGIARGARCTQPVESLDLYPTLVELAALHPKAELEGLSLVPQLRDPHAVRDRPALSTHNPGNHSVRSERWRYIRYADGSEELYDLLEDPNEWRNLANHPSFQEVVEEHRRWLPREEQPHVPGSRGRILEQVDGVWLWEGRPIEPKNLVR
jgi:arylsulfatase A-like enzyme